MPRSSGRAFGGPLLHRSGVGEFKDLDLEASIQAVLFETGPRSSRGEQVSFLRDFPASCTREGKRDHKKSLCAKSKERLSAAQKEEMLEGGEVGWGRERRQSMEERERGGGYGQREEVGSLPRRDTTLEEGKKRT